MQKPIGLILIIAGFVLLIANMAFKEVIKQIPLIGSKPAYIIILGVVLIFLGLVLMKSQRKQHEVPIYDKKGKNVVGYRRMKAL